MKHLAVVVLVACSAPATTQPVKPEVPAPPPAKPDAPLPTVHKLRPVIEAPHTGAILELALSPDGTAAITADELGGLRLWPSLDGKQEPRILSMPVPKQLAIAQTFAVSLDEVGGLYIAKLDPTGRVISHVTIAPDPAFVGMAMTDVGLLAWRADQSLVLIDRDGAIRQHTTTEPAERIINIAVSGKRAMALLEKDGTTRVLRWLTIDPKLGWGATLKLDDPDRGDQLALSPSGTHLAVVHNDAATKSPHVQIVDVAKAAVIASGPTAAIPFELGFIDDDTLAVGNQQGIAWLDAKAGAAKTLPHADNRGVRRTVAFGAAAGHAVTVANGELQISTPSGTQYLGYDIVAPRFVEAAPNGELVVGSRDSVTRIDKQLHSTGWPITLGPNVTQFLSLGGNDWLVEQADAGKVKLSVVDGATSDTKPLRTDLKESNVIMYEPSSQLVTLSFGSVSEVARYDAKTKQLDRITSTTKTSAYEQVLFAPLSPKLANGNQVVQVVMREKPTVKWLRDAHAVDKAAATVTIDGSYAATDAAGHVYLWREGQGGKLFLTVYAEGKPIATLPSDGPTLLWPDRAGKTVALVGANTIALFNTTDGKQLWAQELGSIQEALWLDDGNLAITSGGGIARLEPTTGEVTTARCGWSFGLAAAPHPPTSRVESLCAQLDR